MPPSRRRASSLVVPLLLTCATLAKCDTLTPPSLPSTFSAVWTYTGTATDFRARQAGTLGPNSNSPPFFSWRIDTFLPNRNSSEVYVLFSNSTVMKGSWWDSPDVLHRTASTANQPVIACAPDVTELGLSGLEVGFNPKASQTLHVGPETVNGLKTDHWRQVVESDASCTDLWLSVSASPVVPVRFAKSPLSDTGKCGSVLHQYDYQSFLPLPSPVPASLFSLPSACAVPPSPSPSALPHHKPSSRPTWAVLGAVAVAVLCLGIVGGVWYGIRRATARRRRAEQQNYGSLIDVLQ